MNKRAMELSANFLVMVILGIAMLSMGTVFVRKMFTGASDLKTSLDKQTQEELENLLTAGERVAIPFTKKEVRAGETAIFGLGLLNILGEDSDFVVAVSCASVVPSGTCVSDIILAQPPTIKNNGQHKMSIVIPTDKTTTSRGTHILDVEICNDNPSNLPAFDGTCNGEIGGSSNPTEYYDNSLHKIYLKVS